jgi:hypothetical protein
MHLLAYLHACLPAPPARHRPQLREDKERGIFIDKARSIYVSSAEEMMEVIAAGAENRELSATGMNAGSSRSHSVLIITISQRNTELQSTKSGKLFLVDLAGSEMVSKTGAEGQQVRACWGCVRAPMRGSECHRAVVGSCWLASKRRPPILAPNHAHARRVPPPHTVSLPPQLEEAKMINKSLTSLGKVIKSLTEGGGKHIPYRDSKLTRMLQESLGGNARTVLIICVSMSK